MTPSSYTESHLNQPHIQIQLYKLRHGKKEDSHILESFLSMNFMLTVVNCKRFWTYTSILSKFVIYGMAKTTNHSDKVSYTKTIKYSSMKSKKDM